MSVSTERPLVLVVGETALADALGSDPDLTVHEKVWDSYSGFLESVQIGEAPLHSDPVVVVVSDQLADEEMSLTQFYGYVNNLAVLVPWKTNPQDMKGIVDVVVVGSVTQNALRQAIGRRLDKLLLPVEGGETPVTVELVNLTERDPFNAQESQTRSRNALAALRKTRATTPEFLGNMAAPDRKAASVAKPSFGKDAIAVYSPKAGLDRTEVSIRIGRRLVRSGRSVCLVDLDQTFGDLGSRLGMSSPTVAALLQLHIMSSDVVCPRIPVNESSGIAVVLPLSAPERAEMEELATPDAYRELVSAVAGGFDAVLLSCPFGIADPWTRLGFWQANAAFIIGDNSSEAIADVGQVASLVTRDSDDEYLSGYGIESNRVGIITVEPQAPHLGITNETLDEALEELLGVSFSASDESLA